MQERNQGRASSGRQLYGAGLGDPFAGAQDRRVDTEYTYAGFRAHYAVPVEKTENEDTVPVNRIECEIWREIEDTFSIVVQLYPKGLQTRTEYSLLTYETGKEERKKQKEKYGDHLCLAIPEDAVIWMER